MDASPSSAGPALARWARRLDALLERPWLPWALVAFGIVLRIVRYLSHNALEVSEAELALNILPRSLGETLAPLQYDQAAPPGFVAILILAKELLGSGELALRAFALATSIACLPLFVQLARRMLRPSGVVIATALLAVAPMLVYYGSFAKQYTSDAMFTILLLLLAARVREGRRGALALYAFVGAVALWVSHPAAFVVAGTGSVLAGFAIMERNRNALARLLPVGLLFGASFGAFLASSDRGTTSNSFLLDYWSAGFMPIPPHSLSDLRWFLDRGIGVLEDPGLFFPAGAAALALLTGLVYAWRERSDTALLAISPLPFLISASALHLYPIYGRLVVFLIPILILFISVGVDGLRRDTARTPLLGIVIMLLLLFDPVASEMKKLFAPPRFEDPRPLLEHFKQTAKSDDPLYVYWDTQYAWNYYAPRYGLDPQRAQIGTSAESVWKDDLRDIEKLKGLPRVWVLFSHVHMRQDPRTEEDFFVFELDRIGRRLDERHEPGASLYLYDLSDGGSGR